MTDYNELLFFMQAERICHEVLGKISRNLFEKIEVRKFDNNADDMDISFYSVIVCDQLLEELKKDRENVIVSSAFFENDQILFFVIHLNARDSKKFQKDALLHSKITESLFSFLIEQWKKDNTYFYNEAISSILVRQALESLITEISKRCCKYTDVSLYESVNLSLMTILGELAYITYEKTATQGLIYFTDDKNNAEFQFEFANSEDYGTFSQDNLKLIRKLLELTDSKAGFGIISDSKRIFGIGKIRPGALCYAVNFDKEVSWTLFDGDKEILTMKRNSLVISESQFSKRDFMQYAARIFPKKAAQEDALSDMYAVIKTLVKQQKGTILVVMEDAKNQIYKYQDLCMLVTPVKLDEKNAEKLSSIDGAIFMDENCVCYGFGVVLDGLDTGTGNRARGSRYNSSERFYNQYKRDDGTGLMIFILSDDGNYNLFPPRG